MLITLFFFDLVVAKLKGCLTTENLDRNFQFLLLVVHLFDNTGKTAERAVNNLDRLSNEIGVAIAVDGINLVIHLAEDAVHLILAHGDWFAAVRFAQEVHYIGNILNNWDNLIAQIGLNQHITGEIIAVFDHLFPVAYCIDLLGRNKNLGHIFAPASFGHLAFDVLLSFLLLAAYGSDNIPFFRLLFHAVT